MPSISKIVNVVTNYGIKKPVKFLSNAKFMDNACKKYELEDIKYITKMGILSIVLKDGLGCYLYVKQSLANKDIPSDKRKFVAALDLANGGLMILTQLLTFFTIANKSVQSKMFSSVFNKIIDRPARKGYQALLKNQKKFANLSGREFNIAYQDFLKKSKDTFCVLTSLVASTIIAKRVIVPFIATPLADKAKAFMSRNDKKETVHPETKNTYNTKGVDIEAPENKESSGKLLDRYK